MEFYDKYDEQYLFNNLSVMSFKARVIFSVLCVERLLPLYNWIHLNIQQGNPCIVKNSITFILDNLEKSNYCDDEIQNIINDLEDIFPDNENGIWAVYKELTVLAALHALYCYKNNSVFEAILCERQVYDTLDNYIIDHKHINIKESNDTNFRLNIENNPLIQYEIKYLRIVIDKLLSTTDFLETCDDLHTLSTNAGEYFLLVISCDIK